MRLIYLFIALLLGTTQLQAQERGLDQPHLTNYTPKVGSDVAATSNFRFTFDLKIEPASIGNRTVILKQMTPHKKKINGTVSIENENTLLFSPAKPMEKGTYVIRVKPIKLLKESSTSFKPKNWWQESIVWLCSLFYDDITDCPLCRMLCHVNPTVRTKPIVFTFEVKEKAPKVISLEANATLIELSEHNSTSVRVTATYDNNTTEDVTLKATYSSSDSAVDADKGIITTNGEGSATVTVTYGDKSTNIQVEVYEMIEGHLLPHEPENPDATLLGVDANHNGVRDDVERWIYKEMPTYHHPEIERVIAMQDAKAYQMALEDPTNKDDKVLKAMDRAHDCWIYYDLSKKLPFDDSIKKFGRNLRDKQYNTKERLKTYFQYDYSLKGRVFESSNWNKLTTKVCDKNIDVMP